MPYARTFSSDAFAADLGALFCHQLSACGLSQGELCVCVTDTAWSPSYGAACHAAALSLGAEAVIATVAWDRPPASAVLSSLCDRADLIVYATAHALHYRGELRAALDRGARALCVMEPPHVLDRLRADTEVREKARAGATLLEGAREIRVTSPAGTDLVMDKTGRRGWPSMGPLTPRDDWISGVWARCRPPSSKGPPRGDWCSTGATASSGSRATSRRR
jgi:2,5-dihydroxypyridine 5,6-dioxygenase